MSTIKSQDNYFDLWLKNDHDLYWHQSLTYHLSWFHNYRYSLKTIIADFIVELFHKFQSSLPVNAIYNYTLYRANPGHKFTYPWSCDFSLNPRKFVHKYLNETSNQLCFIHVPSIVQKTWSRLKIVNRQKEYIQYVTSCFIINW